jgi:hypothetical protein
MTHARRYPTFPDGFWFGCGQFSRLIGHGRILSRAFGREQSDSAAVSECGRHERCPEPRARASITGGYGGCVARAIEPIEGANEYPFEGRTKPVSGRSKGDRRSHDATLSRRLYCREGGPTVVTTIFLAVSRRSMLTLKALARIPPASASLSNSAGA